jgi:hypothetical protein
VDFAGRSQPRTHYQANHCSEAVWIAGRPFQEHSNSRFACPIAEDTSLAGMLSYGEVWAPIGIEIGHRTATLLTRQTESSLARAKTPEPAPAVAQEHQTCACILTRGFGIHAKEVLSQKDILTPITIKISN